MRRLWRDPKDFWDVAGHGGLWNNQPRIAIGNAVSKMSKAANNLSMDTLSPSERSERMGRIRGKDTKPEMAVRRLLHSLGYRYRLHRRELPGAPDLVFPSRRKLIFVHGCFWHRHPDPACKLARLPKSKLGFWKPKLLSNQLRDQKNLRALGDLGWEVLVVWECELSNKEQLENKMVRFLERNDAGN